MIDDTPLESFLKQKQWLRADLVTADPINQMIEAQKSQNQSSFNLFCEQLRLLNQLWEHYSEGRFGFKVQQQIWQEIELEAGDLGEKFAQFGQRVGWCTQAQWLRYHHNAIVDSDKQGYFPLFVWFDSYYDQGSEGTYMGIGWRQAGTVLTPNPHRAQVLFSAIEACQL